MSKEFKIGIFGIVAIAILVVGINFLRGLNMLSRQNEYYIAFSDARGVEKSSPVLANGAPVGVVTDVVYDYNTRGRVFITISLDHRLRLPQGTEAVIEGSLINGANVHLVMDDAVMDFHHSGDTLLGVEKKALMDKAADMMPQVEQLLAKVDTLLDNLNGVVGGEPLRNTLANVEEVTANLKVSTNHLNHVLGEDIPRLANTYNRVGENAVLLTEKLNALNLDATLQSVNSTLAEVDQTIANINNPNGTVGALLHDRSLYDNLNHTVQSADSLVTDLKASPKRYVHFSLFGRK